MKPDRWTTALTAVLADRRAELLGRHGDVDQLRDFAAGRLPDDEADEVRELLALHPELAAALDEAGEPPAYGPGHPAHLSAQEQEAGWRNLADRLGLESRPAAPSAGRLPRRRIPWKVVAAVAAGLGAVAIALVLQLGPAAPLSEEIVLRPIPQPRGGGSTAPATLITPRGHTLRFGLELPRVTTREDRFRVVVFELPSATAVWSEDGLVAGPGDRLPVTIPRSRLSAQEYRLDVELAQPAGSPVPLASYSLRMP